MAQYIENFTISQVHTSWMLQDLIPLIELSYDLQLQDAAIK